MIGECTDLGGGVSLGAVHAHRQADDEGMDATELRQPGDAFDGIALANIDGLDGMSEDAEIVGGGDSDARVTVIDAERGVRGS